MNKGDPLYGPWAEKKCPKDCRYRHSLGFCDYRELTNRARGCKPGPDCDKYEPRTQKRVTRMPQPRRHVEGYVRRPTASEALSLDGTALQLYAAGATDPEISRATGWAVTTVRKWRQQNGLESMWRNGKE